MIEICLKDDNMHIFVTINALICINNYVITCINSILSVIILLIDFPEYFEGICIFEKGIVIYPLRNI